MRRPLHPIRNFAPGALLLSHVRGVESRVLDASRKLRTQYRPPEKGSPDQQGCCQDGFRPSSVPTTIRRVTFRPRRSPAFMQSPTGQIGAEDLHPRSRLHTGVPPVGSPSSSNLDQLVFSRTRATSSPRWAANVLYCSVRAGVGITATTRYVFDHGRRRK